MTDELEEAERLRLIFSSQGDEAFIKAIKKLPENSSLRFDLEEWRKTFEEE